MTPEAKAELGQRLAAGRAAARARRAAEQAAAPDPVEAVRAAITPAPAATNGDDRYWVSPSGERIHLSQQPPWAQHVIGKGRDATDARQFVKVPDWYVLRWRSRKSLDTVGQLGWMPVTASSPDVKVLVDQMVAPDKTVQRGYNGDILHFMPREWWENRQAEKQAAADRARGKAVNQQQQFTEDANRGKFGRYIRATTDDKIPVATGFDARSGDHPT